jgi:AcrR family transcriptional regulator
MYTKLSEKKMQVRDDIISAAGKTFKKFGFKKTTMNKIAKETGKGKSSIYYYFESKDDIFKAVVLTEAAKYRKMVIQAIERNETPYEKLKAYILVRMQTDGVLSNFHKALNDPEIRYITFVDRLKKLYDKEEVRLFSNILEAGCKSGFFEIYSIPHASVGIVTAMRGIENTILLNPKDPNIEKKIEDILNIVLYGIVKRK